MSKTIIGLLVAATALWLGGTAYTSSNTEAYLKAYVEKTNKIYEQYGVELSVKEFDKGFFSSNAKVSFDLTEPQIREMLTETFKLPMQMDYNIENGPLFFQNGLGLGASRIVQDVKLSEYVIEKEEFLKIVKDDVKLNSKTTLGFTDNASFSVTSNKIVASLEGDGLEMSPLTVDGNMNMKTLQGNMKMFVDVLMAKESGDTLTAKSIVLDGDITKFYDNGFYLGDFLFNVGSLTTTGDILPLTLEDAKVSLSMTIDANKDETINMKFNVDADTGKSKLPEDYASLQKVKLAYALNGTKLEGLLAFQDYTKRLEEKQQAIVEKLSSSANGEPNMEAFAELQKLQVESAEEMLLIAAGLLKKESTNLVVNMKLLDKKAKESSLKMNVTYVGDEVLPTTAKALEEKFTKEFLNLLAIDLDVELDKEYIANLPVELQQELAGQLQLGAMFGVVKDNNTSYSFDANYKPKTLMVNGEDRSEMLQMLEMGLAQ